MTRWKAFTHPLKPMPGKTVCIALAGDIGENDGFVRVEAEIHEAAESSIP